MACAMVSGGASPHHKLHSGEGLLQEAHGLIFPNQVSKTENEKQGRVSASVILKYWKKYGGFEKW